MDKYKRFYGVLLFIAVIAGLGFCATTMIKKPLDDLSAKKTELTDTQIKLDEVRKQYTTVQTRLNNLKKSSAEIKKKIYAPAEADLGQETLFFSLYSDLIEMVHANSVKIKSINHNPNPENDSFVANGQDKYFVTDIDMELVSNYTDLGKLLQEIFQYRYYIKINSVEVKPFKKDKKVLITKLSVRMYSKTAPEEEIE